MSEYSNNNKAVLTGEVIDSPAFSHEVYGEKFYLFTMRVPRLSEICDTVKILASERLPYFKLISSVGDFISVKGQFRSYNNYTGEGNRLVLTVFAKDIQPADYDSIDSANEIILDGFVCREPVYRVTPFGREIADVLIAVNRSYNKSDYIPAIAWGRNARFCRDLEVGSHIKVTGRIQSREYQKRINENDVIAKTAYEVSISIIELV